METESTPTLPFSEVREIFGEKNCINPEVIGDILKVNIGNPELSLITCSIKELEQHAEAGRFLTFRISKTHNGKPMTMKEVCKLAKSKPDLNIGGSGKILLAEPHSDYWFKKKPFFTEDVPRPGFAIIDKDIALNSIDKNFIEQTALVAKCASLFFKTLPMPRIVKEAIREFKGAFIEEYAGNIATKLAELQMTKLFRQTPVEFLYDSELYMQQNNELLCKEHAVLTSCLSDSSFVFVEGLNSLGMTIGRMKPEEKHKSLGMCFVRPLALRA